MLYLILAYADNFLFSLSGEHNSDLHVLCLNLFQWLVKGLNRLKLLAEETERN